MTTVPREGTRPVIDMSERVEAFTDAGFEVYYAHREDAVNGYVSSSNLTGRYSGGVKVRDVIAEPSDHYGEPFVSFEDVASSEDSYGQADTVRRSNYIAIKRDYPDTPWIEVSYLNMFGLGMFVYDTDPDVTEMMIGLKVDYPVYDESAMSELEQSEIEESWSEWLRDDLKRALPDVTGETIWDYLGEDTVTEIFWSCVSQGVFGSYPEHRGVEVAWGPVEDLARDFRPYLCAAYWGRRTGRDIGQTYVWVDRLYSRLSARAEVARLYRSFVADETIMHHDGAWSDYLNARGWVITADGVKRKGRETA